MLKFSILNDSPKGIAAESAESFIVVYILFPSFPIYSQKIAAESAEPLLLRLLWPKLRAAQRRSAAADEAQLGGPGAGATVA